MNKLVGQALLRNPLLNKGTAFTEKERVEYQLQGLLPTQVQTLEQQAEVVYQQVQSFDTPLAKHQFLMNLYDLNRILFYRVLADHVTEFLPIVYTPTIGDAVIQYSKDYLSPKDAVFLDADKPAEIREILENGTRDLADIKLIVITDGEGVLGIGDWGIQGVSISVGKLVVYTVASGLNPRNVLPVVIDAGTNNQQLLDDPNYLGKKQARIGEAEYDKFIEKFVAESTDLFPNVLLHWEDFGRGNASRILENYRDKVCTFNDDIQGTGVMMVSAVSAVAKVTEKPVKDLKIVVFGAGTAGIGISDQILLDKIAEGLPETEARQQFYLVDRYGLVIEGQSDLTSGQQQYARTRSEFPEDITDLAEIIRQVQPDVLIGTSGQPGSFTQEVVEAMSAATARPAIMPISNPTKLCEAKAEDIIRWSDGKALVVTGSPSAPVEYEGVTYQIGQANNALLYPGLGLGIVVAEAKTVSDGMLSAAAHGIASLQDLAQAGASILPPVNKLREASKLVATAVVEQAIKENLNQVAIQNPQAAVEAAIWEPEYEI